MVERCLWNHSVLGNLSLVGLTDLVSLKAAYATYEGLIERLRIELKRLLKISPILTDFGASTPYIL